MQIVNTYFIMKALQKAMRDALRRIVETHFPRFIQGFSLKTGFLTKFHLIIDLVFRNKY